jgi:Zn-dependent protease with chaperone function
MRFTFFSILLFFFGGTSDLYAFGLETTKLIKMNKESLREQGDLDKSEKVKISQFTQIVDGFVALNKKYIIPLSYTYICFDVSKNLFGVIANSLMEKKGEKIFPYCIGSNPLHQKIVSKVNEIAAKVGALPWSIVITEDKPGWWAGARGKNLIISKTFFENNSGNEVDYIIAHELSHIKRGHSDILKTALASLTTSLMGIFGVITSSEDYNLTSNFNKIIKMICTSPLLYYFSAKVIWYALSRYCEKDADLTTAAAVGTEGGIAFFGRFLDECKTGFFDTHPCAQERLEYFQAFQNTK